MLEVASSCSYPFFNELVRAGWKNFEHVQFALLNRNNSTITATLQQNKNVKKSNTSIYGVSSHSPYCSSLVMLYIRKFTWFINTYVLSAVIINVIFVFIFSFFKTLDIHWYVLQCLGTIVFSNGVPPTKARATIRILYSVANLSGSVVRDEGQYSCSKTIEGNGKTAEKVD